MNNSLPEKLRKEGKGGKSIPGRVNRLHKGPEVGMSLTCLRNSQETSVARAGIARDKLREVTWRDFAFALSEMGSIGGS